jgi:hypothetical protein
MYKSAYRLGLLLKSSNLFWLVNEFGVQNFYRHCPSEPLLFSFVNSRKATRAENPNYLIFVGNHSVNKRIALNHSEKAVVHWATVRVGAVFDLATGANLAGYKRASVSIHKAIESIEQHFSMLVCLYSPYYGFLNQ